MRELLGVACKNSSDPSFIGDDLENFRLTEGTSVVQPENSIPSSMP
jgi:hypothetical protein